MLTADELAQLIAAIRTPTPAPQANPPIVIGSFDNVPAPGSPIKSDWPQEISTYVQALPKGSMGTGLGYVVDTVHTSGQPVPNMSVAFNAVLGRTYMTIASLSAHSTGTGAAIDLIIADAANATLTAKVAVVSNNSTNLTTVHVATAGATGSQTRKAIAAASAGTLTIVGGANRVGIIVVIDLGAALPGLLLERLADQAAP